MIKAVVCFLSVAICGIWGYRLSNKYIKRKKFFDVFFLFLKTLKADINFSGKKLKGILKNNNLTSCQEFNLLINNYCLLLDVGDFGELFACINILSLDEMEMICSFFKNLGKVDVYNQVKNIEAFECVVANFLKSADEDCKRYGSLYTKLGVLAGILVVILII